MSVLKRVYRFLVPKQEQKVNETVPIEEYNKLKQVVDEKEAIRDALTRENERIMKENDVTIAEAERLESEIRVEKIRNILQATTLTDAEKEKQLQVLPTSGLSIEFIQSTYEPITKKNINKFETKLPHITNRKDSSYIK